MLKTYFNENITRRFCIKTSLFFFILWTSDLFLLFVVKFDQQKVSFHLGNSDQIELEQGMKHKLGTFQLWEQP